MHNLIDTYRRNHIIALVVVVAAAMIYAFHQTWPNDDAYISFRYAKNLVEGHGLVWNIGERVEGYSNFLWTLLIALGIRLGGHPEQVSVILAIPIQLLCLILTYILGRSILKSNGYALLAVALTGFNHSVAGFATSGLETSLQLLEFLLVAIIFSRAWGGGWTKARTLWFSVVLNIALLTRPDAVVLVGVALVGWFMTAKSRRLSDFLPLLLPFAMILLPYLIWKSVYYGSLLPNSYYAKVHGLTGAGWGAFYLYLFIVYYMLIPYLAVVAFRGRSLLRDPDRRAGYLALFCFIWMGYVAAVGGDFMEFRFMVPIVPLLMIVIIHVLKTYIADKRVAVALSVALFIGVINNMLPSGRLFYNYGVEKVENLYDHLYAPDENWVDIGKQLGELFGGTDIVLSCGASGAIPYYSNLQTVDFMGLNDPVIPHIGEEFSSMAGHRIIAPLEYLYQRGVNLIVQPIVLVMKTDEFRRWMRTAQWGDIYRFFMDVDNPINGEMINEATLIAVPFENDYVVLVWYLQQHDEIDRVISENRLMTVRLKRR